MRTLVWTGLRILSRAAFVDLSRMLATNASLSAPLLAEQKCVASPSPVTECAGGTRQQTHK